MKRFALISGVAYLMVFFTGFYANFTVLESMVDWGNMKLSTQNFIDFHSNLGRGLLAFTVMLFFDLVLVFSLFPITVQAHKKLTYIASALRLGHAIGFAIGLLGLFKVYRLTAATVNGNKVELVSKVQYGLQDFDFIWTIALIIFGIHLLILGYLSLRFKAFPKYLGLFLVLAAMGYVVDGSAKLFLPSYMENKDIFELCVVSTGILGEFSFTIWLWFKVFTGFYRNAGVHPHVKV